MNVKVDLGDNTTQLIEQLATQLNMTVDKVFPFYVEMVQIRAIASIIIYPLVGILLLGMLIFFYKRIKNSDDPANIIPTFVTGIILFFIFVLVIVGGNETITQIVVPEPYAIKALVADAGKLLGK